MIDYTEVITALGTVIIGAIVRGIEKRYLRKKGKLHDKIEQ